MDGSPNFAAKHPLFWVTWPIVMQPVQNKAK